ncbi:MAG TPA: hypothetical protein VMD04_03170, partial [Candidatus Margulisiibacteriota bacterium]|nr:hypothetical protein [Candidatus Margulisiibacteriota bacterium]
MAKIIICTGFVLFLLISFLGQATYPEIVWSNDFFGYIELGRNIFNKLSFVVHWQLDNPIIYPPLFSILTHLLTLFTKNPLISIQYLNAFSASLCLIPLFLVTKKLLNNFSAFLVTIFMVYFLAQNRPCYFPYIEYFFTFLTLTVFWFIWDLLTRENKKAASFIFLGILISLAYLTKYHGIIYCLWAVILIFCFFRQGHYGLKVILKRISFLVLGFLPLFITYHTLLHINGRDEEAGDAGVFLFMDGIKGDREHQIYMLNPGGREFNYLSDCRSFTAFSFCSKYPELVQRRYVEGLKSTLRIMTRCVFPFKFAEKKYFYIITQFILLFLTMAAWLKDKYRLKIIVVSLFASTALLIPLYLYQVSEKYLIPFMPFYFILWLLGINGLYNAFQDNTKFVNLKRFARLLIIALTIILACNYSLIFYKSIRSSQSKA